MRNSQSSNAGEAGNSGYRGYTRNGGGERRPNSETNPQARSLDPQEQTEVRIRGNDPAVSTISQHSNICAAYGALFESGKFTDLTLVCQNRNFNVHRVVLAAQSNVFAAQLFGDMKESRQTVIEISEGCEPEIFESFLRFLYKGEITMHMDNIKALLTLAEFYQVRALHNACFSFLDEQDFDMQQLLAMLQTWRTAGDAIQGYFMSRYCDLVPSFSEFVKAKEFLTMNESVLIELLKLDQLCLEESEVLQAVISWGKHQLSNGTTEAKTLEDAIAKCICHIRFELMDTKFIVQEVLSQKLLSNERFVEIMRRKYSDECPPPRRSTSFVAYDDNKRGVFYYIGSDGFKRTWRNPAKHGLIAISLSSSGGASRHSICDRKWGVGAVENSYGSTPTWIQFDLKSYQLVPRSYIVHQDQDHFLRNWRFEASNDGIKWTDLATYTNDTTITSENRCGHFHLRCGKPYQRFRIYLTGPSHKGQQSFDITQVEMFGRILPLKNRT
mmetsp:Transcript_9834/g.24212  ORF Transcript_9834/g.24212 Transcript_9834/m.24212 type:complete len:498 (-) Transcript_9834:215-1708(-)